MSSATKSDMSHLRLLLILLPNLLGCVNTQSITIGNLNGATIIPLTNVTIKQNDENPSLPLHIEGVNAEVRLSCSLENDPLTPGLAGAVFIPRNITVGGSIQTNIEIRTNSLKPGRTNAVTCLMQIPSQIMNQLSDKLPFRVTRAPYIVIPESTVVIPNQLNVWTGTFLIKFSEQVNGGAVIRCSINTGTIGHLDFPDQTVSFGMAQYSFTYRIRTYSPTSYGVVCSMMSNVTNPVPQYKFDTSQTDVTTFKFDRGKISLTTNYQQITQPFVQFVLYKEGENLLTDDTFKPNCQIKSFTDYQQALRYQSSLTCQPDYYGVTQAPTTSPTTQPAMSTTQSTTSTTAGINSTTIYPGTESTWVIDDGSGITNGDTSSILVIRTSPNVTYPLEEFISLTCCSVSTSQRNEALEVSGIYEVKISAQPVVRQDDVTDGYTQYENPAYVNIAPCPCDLTSYSCDPQCECDDDCGTEYAEINVHEITGRFGGKGSPIADHFCDSVTKYDTPDWKPVLCTLTAKSAYLGLFYPEYPDVSTNQLITDDSDFINRISARKSEYSYESSENVNRPYMSSYRYGSYIHLKDGAILTLPKTNGGCIDRNPIRYLMDADTGCSFSMTSDLCSQDSRLNIYNYVLPPSTVSASDFSVVLQIANGNNTVPVNVSYYCATSANLSPLTYCSWDDGVSPPPTPVLSANTCQNSVIDVQYTIRYNGASITRIEVQYIMRDVDLETSVSSEHVELFYETNTYNQTVNGTNQTELISEQVLNNNTVTRTNTKPTTVITKYRTEFLQAGVTTLTKYAGKPGYNFDTSPYIAVLTQTEQLQLSDALKLPLPGVDGLCEFSSKANVTFPDSQSSNCQVLLNRTDFDDCQALRYRIFELLESFYPVKEQSYVSRFGVPNLNRRDHWVPILRDFNDSNNTTTEQTNSTTPAQTTSSETQTTSSVTQTTPLTDSSTTSASQISVSRVCSNLPTAVNIQFLYANTGRSGGHVIWQITGSKISILESELRMTCKELSCGQKFNIQYSSQFTEVPLIPLPPKTRYQLRKEKESLQDEQPWRIDSLLYPVGHEVPEQFRSSYIAMFLFIFSLFCVMFILSRPWWHKHYGIF